VIAIVRDGRDYSAFSAVFRKRSKTKQRAPRAPQRCDDILTLAMLIPTRWLWLYCIFNCLCEVVELAEVSSRQGVEGEVASFERFLCFLHSRSPDMTQPKTLKLKPQLVNFSSFPSSQTPTVHSVGFPIHVFRFSFKKIRAEKSQKSVRIADISLILSIENRRTMKLFGKNESGMEPSVIVPKVLSHSLAPSSFTISPPSLILSFSLTRSHSLTLVLSLSLSHCLTLSLSSLVLLSRAFRLHSLQSV